MSDNNRILIRNARDQDLPAVAEINAEAFTAHGTAEKLETFQLRLATFQDGFIILVAENEIAAYGCSEKWLTEHEPALDVNPAVTHDLDGRIFYITSLAVKKKYEGRGFRLLVLDKLIEIARSAGCKKIMVETTHAQDLYIKRGFKTVQNRTEHEISSDVMSLDLKPTGL